MSRHADLMRSRVICTVALLALAAAMALAQAQDEADDLAIRAAAHEHARQAAQVATWGRLEREGCAMVACDRMRPP